MLQQTQHLHNGELEIPPGIVLKPQNTPNCKELFWWCDKASDVFQYWIRITFLKFTKNAPKAKVFRRAAPFGVTLLAGRYFCMSITVPDFRFSPRYDFHTSITNPPLTYLGPGKRTLVRGRGGENDFTQIQFLASISNFLSLTKWKF